MYLETSRCLIRPFSMDDAEALHLALSDPEIMRFIEPPFDLPKTQAFIRDTGLSTPPLTYALVWKETGTVIGHVIFHPYPGSQDWEMGWVIRKCCWSKGIAGEVSIALMDYARQQGIPGLIIECDPEQETTRHIAMKLGFQLIGEADGCLVFRFSL